MKTALFALALLTAFTTAHADELEIRKDIKISTWQNAFILKDTLSGCEYIAITSGGLNGGASITPRMAPDGHQVCTPSTPAK